MPEIFFPTDGKLVSTEFRGRQIAISALIRPYSFEADQHRGPVTTEELLVGMWEESNGLKPIGFFTAGMFLGIDIAYMNINLFGQIIKPDASWPVHFIDLANELCTPLSAIKVTEKGKKLGRLIFTYGMQALQAKGIRRLFIGDISSDDNYAIYRALGARSLTTDDNNDLRLFPIGFGGRAELVAETSNY